MPDAKKPFLIEKKPFLCKLGIHKWGEPHLQELINKHVEGWEKRCLSCDEVKRWTRHKSYTYKE
jgi:hypothetical protein